MTQIRIKGARVLVPGNIDDKKDVIIKDHFIEFDFDPDYDWNAV